MPEPRAVELANEFRDRLIANDAAMTQEMARRWLAVEEALFEEMVTLAEKVAADQAHGLAISRSRLLRLERYQRLLLQVQEQLIRFNAGAASQIDRAAIEAASQGLLDALEMIDAVIGPGQRAVEVVFDRLNVGAAENIAALARAGQPLDEILARSYPLAVDGITDRLIAGTAAGENPRTVARRMRNEGLAQGLNHILLVARDQANRSMREASRQQYRRSGVVEAYQRIAAKQPGRTCLACIALDGTIYETDEFMAVHPQDRCGMIPVVTGFERVRFTAGEAYFRSLDEAVQREWMGPERFELWQEGQFEFGQMAKIVENETWGPSAQVRPVRELQ